MDQLSLFAPGDPTPGASSAGPADAAGLLAGRGQSTLSGARARVSVVVDAPWRAGALVELLADAGLGAVVEPGVDAEAGRERWSVVTGWSEALAPVVAGWRRGAVSAVPEGWTPGPRQLRAWVLGSGHVREGGVVELGIDPGPEQHAPRREALAAALARAGVRSRFVGARAGGPALRVSSARAVRRLAEMVGEPPADAPGGAWPAGG